MPTIVHEFAWPDRVVVGTVGLPGSRTFYLQVRAGSQLITVAVEKEQASLLTEKIEEILNELMAAEGNPYSVPSSTPIELVDNEPLELPIELQFRTGVMSLGWDPSTVQMVIEAFPLILVDEETDLTTAEELAAIEPAEMLTVRLPVGTARAFAKRTREIVGAGRPLCPRCGMPIDAEGHICASPDAF